MGFLRLAGLQAAMKKGLKGKKHLRQIFSTEAQYLERSVMRDLIQLTAQPDIIPLSGGLPASELLPVDDIRDCVDAVLAREGGNALQYRPMYGPLVEWIVAHMQSRGVSCTPEQVFITNGNQQSLTILSRIFMNIGQTACTEEIVFTGVQQVTSGRNATMRLIKTDLETGIDVDELATAFETEPHPKLAVVIPDFHNPLGVSISEEKRQRIAELAATYRIPLLEDDPYSSLRFRGESLKPIKAFDEESKVFYLGSFSKMLIPAARLGWIVAPVDVIPKLTVFREAIDLESSAFMQRIVGEYLSRNLLEGHLERLNAVHRERCDVMLDALDEHLGDVATWTKPDGGLFIWMTLSEQLNTWDMFKQAIEAKVAYIPGGAFAVKGGHVNTMRLNFSKVEPDIIREGVKRLAAVIRENLQSTASHNM